MVSLVTVPFAVQYNLFFLQLILKTTQNDQWLDVIIYMELNYQIVKYLRGWLKTVGIIYDHVMFGRTPEAENNQADY